MAVPPFNILDTKLGDRVLGPDQVAALLAQAGADPAFSSPPPIGDTTPNTGAFSALTAATLELGTGTKTATATGTTTATATLNKSSGIITSAALTTAAAGTWVLTLTNSQIEAGDVVLANVGNGTNTDGAPVVCDVTVTGANTVVITVKNVHASTAFNGTITIGFAVIK